jgi:hypothetical protein
LISGTSDLFILQQIGSTSQTYHIQGALRSTINDFFLYPNLVNNRACPTPERPPLMGTDRILDFEKSSLFGNINSFLKTTAAGGALNQVCDVFPIFIF